MDNETILAFGEFELADNPPELCRKKRGRPEVVKLTKQDLRILLALANSPRRAVALIDKVWGGDVPGHRSTVPAAVGRLRSKLGAIGTYIHPCAEPGTYRLEADVRSIRRQNAETTEQAPVATGTESTPPEPIRASSPATVAGATPTILDCTEYAVDLSERCKLQMVLIPPGEFTMGSPKSETDRDNKHKDEDSHNVRITQPFQIGKYPVTRGQFELFVENTRYKTEAETNGRGGAGYDLASKGFKWPAKNTPCTRYWWRFPGFEQTVEDPVVNVSWKDAVVFCKWLTEKEERSDTKYRLPTEAEWEYCCRAGTKTRFHSGDDDASLEQVANIAAKSLQKMLDPNFIESHMESKQKTQVVFAPWEGHAFTTPVGQFQPNAWRLYDMHGNVWEWCHDWYGKDYYKSRAAKRDPRGPRTGPCRVLRGGSFANTPPYCRSAFRRRDLPNFLNFAGFRVVRVVQQSFSSRFVPRPVGF